MQFKLAINQIFYMLCCSYDMILYEYTVYPNCYIIVKFNTNVKEGLMQIFMLSPKK